MGDERWERVVGFRRYMVSDLGRVKSRETGLMVVPYRVPSSKVPLVELTTDAGAKVTKKLSRIVCDAFIYDPDGYSQILYKNGDKTDCRLVNLIRAGDPEKTPPRKKYGKERARAQSKYIGIERTTTNTVVETDTSRMHRYMEKVKVVETGQEFESATAMCVALGLDAATVSKMLRGQGDQWTHKGYTFAYVDNPTAPREKPVYIDRMGRSTRSVRVRETGAIFPSQSECARYLGIKQSRISGYLNRKVKSPIDGYTFEYVEGDENGISQSVSTAVEADRSA